MVQHAVRRDLIAASGIGSSIDAFCAAIGVDVIVIQFNPSCICSDIPVLVLLSQINRRKAKHPGLVLAEPSDQSLAPSSL